MITLNEARTRLHVGRRRLMNLLEELRIEPIQIHARRQEITPEQLEILQQHLQGLPTPESAEDTSTTSSTDGSTVVQPVVKLLEEQIGYLKQEIEGHKEEKRELLQSNDRIQQLLSVSMSEASKLRQENDRLRLLEHHPESSSSSGRDLGEVEAVATEVEDQVSFSTSLDSTQPAEPVNYAPAKSSWGLGIGLGAVAAAIILYVLTSDQGAKFFPNIQQKLVGALHLSDTNSIVPYRFDENGGLR